MNYIILDIVLGQPEKREDKYLYNPSIKIGIEGDSFGLSLGDGCTVDITDFDGKPSEIEQLIKVECKKYVDGRYNK